MLEAGRVYIAGNVDVWNRDRRNVRVVEAVDLERKAILLWSDA